MHECGGASSLPVVRNAADFWTKPHEINKCASVLQFRSSQMRVPQNNANFGIGTLAMTMNSILSRLRQPLRRGEVEDLRGPNHRGAA